jgi:glycine cleavage system H protein
VNSGLVQEPGNANSDPYGKAWMIKVELSTPAETAELLSADAYKKLVESL